MFLQIQTPKQFLVPFQVSVGLKQQKTSMDLVRRGHERVTTLLELLETQGIEKNKELVDNLVSLQDDFLTLKKKVKNLNDGTVFFAVVLSAGFTDLATSLGFTTKEWVKKDIQYADQRFSFVERSKRVLVHMGILKSFQIILVPENPAKVHPKLGSTHEPTLYYNTQVDFSEVRKNLLDVCIEIPFDENGNNGENLVFFYYKIVKVKNPKKTQVSSLFLPA